MSPPGSLLLGIPATLAGERGILPAKAEVMVGDPVTLERVSVLLYRRHDSDR
jgi:hypothetical protein